MGLSPHCTTPRPAPTDFDRSLKGRGLLGSREVGAPNRNLFQRAEKEKGRGDKDCTAEEGLDKQNSFGPPKAKKKGKGIAEEGILADNWGPFSKLHRECADDEVNSRLVSSSKEEEGKTDSSMVLIFGRAG